MPLIISATSRFCSGLSSFVVTGEVLLVVFLFFLFRSFIACSLAEYFSIRFWVYHVIHNNYSFPYHLVVLLMSNPFSLWFLFLLSSPPRTPPPHLPRSLLSLLNPLPDELTCYLRTYLSDDGWVGGKGRDITVDKYVEAVLKLALWIDL